MNTIEFLAMFINVLVSCTALPMDATRIGGQEFMVQNWVCQVDKGPIKVRAWRRMCETNGNTYMGRQFFIEFRDLDQTALYLDQFGEILMGQGARLEEAYLPSCGS